MYPWDSVTVSEDMELDTPMAVHSFQCQFCEEVFSSSIQMAQHWQDHHQEDQVHVEQHTCTPVYQPLQTSAFALASTINTNSNTIDTSINTIVTKTNSSDANTNTSNTNTDTIDTNTIITNTNTSSIDKYINTVNNIRVFINESDSITATNQHISCEDSSLRHEACREKLASRTSLQNHIQSHKSESSKGIIVTKASAEVKSAVSRGTKDFCCEVCGRTYATKSNLNKHCRTHTDVLFSCSYMYCQTRFRYKESLKKHEKCHLRNKNRKDDHGSVYRCQYCRKIFPDKLKLSIHFRSHPLEKTFKCDQCERTFMYKSGLKRHTLSHTSVKAQACPQCKRSFLTISNLKAHMKTHSDKKQFACDKCDKAFTQKLTLIEHMRLHENIRSYKCSYCGKCFRQRSTLWGHEKIHKREKVHKCSKCEEHFGTLKDLKKHEKKHWVDSQRLRSDTDGNFVNDSLGTEKRFECDRCGEIFTQKAVLQTHYRRHTGEKPFNCEECGKKFRHLASHKRHALIHKGVKKYPCGICNKSFTKKSYLEWHISKLHSNSTHSNHGRVCNTGNKGTLEVSDCLPSRNEQMLDEDPGCTLSLEGNDDSESDSDPPRLKISACEKVSQAENESNSAGNMNNLGDFMPKDNFDDYRDQKNLTISQVESLNTPGNESPQVIDGIGMTVAFQDVCDVSINEECVHTMNILDHVMQLSQISQRDLEESPIPMEDTCITLGQSTLEDISRKVVIDSNEKIPGQSMRTCNINVGKQNLNGVKPFVCELCGRMYSSYSNLLRHKQTHLNSKPHKCCFCDKSYSRRPLLREHIQFSHSGPHGAHQCTFCEKSFPNATRLELHVRTHTQNKPFKCNACQKGFTDSSNLRRHERSHQRLRTHKCLDCGQLFSEKPALQRHLARHRGEKIFHCQRCAKSFALKADLQSHSILHIAAKDSTCSLCGLAFQRQISFNLHQACTKKSARKCRVCNIGCVNECRRRQHELNEHKFLITDTGFACGHCQKSFSKLGKIVGHIRKHCGISSVVSGKRTQVSNLLAQSNDIIN